MLEKKGSGMYIDTDNNSIVFEYDELDEASKRSFDTLSQSIRDNPPNTWVEPKHKNEAVEGVLSDLRGDIEEIQESIYTNDGEPTPHEEAILQMLEELTSTLRQDSKFDKMEASDVFLFVKNYFVTKKSEAELALLDNSAEDIVLEAYEGVQGFCEQFIDERLKEKDNV
jgi:hypothetical protein